jgi:hypothetical protein
MFLGRALGTLGRPVSASASASASASTCGNAWRARQHEREEVDDMRPIDCGLMSIAECTECTPAKRGTMAPNKPGRRRFPRGARPCSPSGRAL